jgi:hypothetical protein
MDKFYYIIAQLPTLRFDQEAPLSIEDFMMESRKWMSRRDFRLLSDVDFGNVAWMDDGGLKRYGAWKRFRDYEHSLRSKLAQWRKARLGQDADKSKRVDLPLAEDGNPLEVEKRLLHQRWLYIDELERGHNFDLEYLILYYIRLQILERVSLFSKEEGMRAFEEVIGMELWETEMAEEDRSASSEEDGETS